MSTAITQTLTLEIPSNPTISRLSNDDQIMKKYCCQTYPNQISNNHPVCSIKPDFLINRSPDLIGLKTTTCTEINYPSYQYHPSGFLLVSSTAQSLSLSSKSDSVVHHVCTRYNSIGLTSSSSFGIVPVSRVDNRLLSNEIIDHYSFDDEFHQAHDGVQSLSGQFMMKRLENKQQIHPLHCTNKGALGIINSSCLLSDQIVSSMNNRTKDVVCSAIINGSDFMDNLWDPMIMDYGHYKQEESLLPDDIVNDVFDRKFISMIYFF